MRIFSFLSLIFLFSFSSVQAEPVDRKEEVKQFVQDTLSMMEVSVEQQAEGGDLRFEGELAVEEVDGYYAVTTPDISYYLGKYRVEIGMIASNMMLLTEPGEVDQWSISAALPTPIFVYEEDKMIGQLKVGNQKISSLWVPSILFWANLDYEFTDIEYNDFVKSTKVSVDSVKVKRTSIPLDDGLWNIDEAAMISDISVKTPSDQGFFRIGGMDVTSKTQAFDPLTVKRNVDNLNALTTWSVENDNNVDITAFMDIFKNLTQSFQQAKTTINVKDITFKDSKKGDTFSIPDFKMTSDYRNNEAGYVSGGLSFNVDEIQTEAQPAVAQIAQTTLPLVFDFQYHVENFPKWDTLKPIFEEAQILSKLEAQPDSDPMVVEAKNKALQEKLTASLQEVGLVVGIDKLSIGIPTSSLNIKGDFRFDEAAAKDVVTDFVITISGLEETMQKSGQQAGPVAMFLPMITAMGEVVEDSDPNSKSVTYKYHIQLTQSGQMLVNGQDMSSMMGGMAPSEEPAGIVNPHMSPAPLQ